MLHAGGAIVTLAGFTRGQVKVARIGNIEPVNLGHTSDGKFAQRLLAVGRALCKLSSTLRNVAKPDVIIARNLEMLALANRASTLGDWNAPIVYECLDIHRMLLRQDIIGRVLALCGTFIGAQSQTSDHVVTCICRQLFHAVQCPRYASHALGEQGLSANCLTGSNVPADSDDNSLEDWLVRRFTLSPVTGITGRFHTTIERAGRGYPPRTSSLFGV